MADSLKAKGFSAETLDILDSARLSIVQAIKGESNANAEQLMMLSTLLAEFAFNGASFSLRNPSDTQQLLAHLEQFAGPPLLASPSADVVLPAATIIETLPAPATAHPNPVPNSAAAPTAKSEAEAEVIVEQTQKESGHDLHISFIRKLLADPGQLAAHTPEELYRPAYYFIKKLYDKKLDNVTQNNRQDFWLYLGHTQEAIKAFLVQDPNLRTLLNRTIKDPASGFGADALPNAIALGNFMYGRPVIPADVANPAPDPAIETLGVTKSAHKDVTTKEKTGNKSAHDLHADFIRTLLVDPSHLTSHTAEELRRPAYYFSRKIYDKKFDVVSPDERHDFLLYLGLVQEAIKAAPYIDNNLRSLVGKIKTDPVTVGFTVEAVSRAKALSDFLYDGRAGLPVKPSPKTQTPMPVAPVAPELAAKSEDKGELIDKTMRGKGAHGYHANFLRNVIADAAQLKSSSAAKLYNTAAYFGRLIDDRKFDVISSDEGHNWLRYIGVVREIIKPALVENIHVRGALRKIMRKQLVAKFDDVASADANILHDLIYGAPVKRFGWQSPKKQDTLPATLPMADMAASKEAQALLKVMQKTPPSQHAALLAHTLANPESVVTADVDLLCRTAVYYGNKLYFNKDREGTLVERQSYLRFFALITKQLNDRRGHYSDSNMRSAISHAAITPELYGYTANDTELAGKTRDALGIRSVLKASVTSESATSGAPPDARTTADGAQDVGPDTKSEFTNAATAIVVPPAPTVPAQSHATNGHSVNGHNVNGPHVRDLGITNAAVATTLPNAVRPSVVPGYIATIGGREFRTPDKVPVTLQVPSDFNGLCMFVADVSRDVNALKSGQAHAPEIRTMVEKIEAVGRQNAAHLGKTNIGRPLVQHVLSTVKYLGEQTKLHLGDMRPRLLKVAGDVIEHWPAIIEGWNEPEGRFLKYADDEKENGDVRAISAANVAICRDIKKANIAKKPLPPKADPGPHSYNDYGYN